MERSDLCLLYLPGNLVEWRPGLFDSWQLATVVEVTHQGDHTGWFTSVVVTPESTSLRCVLVGPTLKTFLRPLGTS
jgi:hypothetical protein